jgi:DNA-binding beta-propeller fold protein YncE
MIEHKEHEYDFVKKAAPKTKEKLSENLVPLKEIQVSLHEATQNVKSTKSAVEVQGESVATTIEQSFNELHEIIEQRKRELLEKAASMTKGKLDRLSVQEKGFEMASGTVQSLVDFVEQNIENATEEELMSIHTQVMNRISEETKKHQCSRAELEPVEKANLMVDVSCAMEVKKICQEKTNLVEMFVIDPVIKDAEIGKPAVIQVSCKSVNPVWIESKLVSVADGTVISATAQQKRNDIYQIEYVPKVRGRHMLGITANGLPVPGSPFPVFVKIPPTQLGKPVKVIGGVKMPVGIAINSVGELLVAEQLGDNIIVLDKRGKKVRSIQKVQHGFERLRGITIDKDDNIYLIDRNKLFKFNYELVKAVVSKNAWGVVVVKEQAIVGLRDNSKCQVNVLDREFNLEKTFDLETIGVRDIMGIAVDEHMNLYICDYDNNCIHVVSQKNEGELLYSFGQEQLKLPHSICTSGGLVYISTWSDHKIFVFTKEGILVASFGSQGKKEGQFSYPSGLVVDADGYLYVCDIWNHRLQLF